MSNSQIFEQEKKKMKEILKEVNRELEETEQQYNTLENNTADEFLLATLGKTYSNKIRNLKKALKNPYFARVDFKEHNMKTSQKIYIGKTNVFDEDSNVIIIDWRAPISSIYYDGEIGETEYECPEGIIKGELQLKRQYNIQDAELIEYNDIDITTNDEILGKVLDENSDVRLKNIVATIQKEQNKIIRSSMFKPLIVQGVAGSGKTTVAIHRIAYLIYTYEKELNPEEILIIAPNKFFLGYIKNSLPDLGVDYVLQQTFEEFLLETINQKIIIEDTNKKLKEIINKKQNQKEVDLIIESSKFKTSLEFKVLTDEYLDNLNNNLIKEDFKIANIIIMTYDEIKNLLFDNYERFSLKERLDRLQNFMKNKVANLSENISDKITEKRREKLEKISASLSMEEQQNIRKKIFEETEYEINNLLKNKGNKLVIDYMKKIKIPSVLEIYKNIINSVELLNKYTNNELGSYISKTTSQKLKIKMLEYEDLAAIMHLHYKILGINENNKLKHIVIDEAQDYGEFQFFALSEILSNNKSLTILGDVAQGIYEFRGTNNWNRINDKIFNNEANIEFLNQSYRTTENIMNEANKVLQTKKYELNITLAKCISRKGEKVNFHKIRTYEEKIKIICEIIDNIEQKGYRNIGIISKNDDECNKIYEQISKKYNDVQIISEKSVEYSGGITILPSYYSKGLEFDSVIISDYSSYNDSILDTKLLYVALTRAMHTLDIISNY